MDWFKSRRAADPRTQWQSTVITETPTGTILPWPARRFLSNEASTRSAVRGRVQDRSRETTSRCQMIECHPGSLRQIFPPPSRDGQQQSSHPGTNPDADDRGGGRRIQ